MPTLITGNDGANTLTGGAGDDVIYGFDPDGPQSQVGTIAATRVASGLTNPLYAVAPPNDLGRLFIVEKGGLVKILDLATNQVLPTPFLNVTAQISADGEGGLLGLAFDPDFATNGNFYVDLINTSGDTEIRRFHVSPGTPNVADAGMGTLIIGVDQPAGLTNHKAGWIAFGPDGDLYAALGDGGGGGDPNGSGQDMNSLLGKMLRLDVSQDGFPADASRNYAIPADNPFAGVGVAGADEIWALGLRNPWRDSFDRAMDTFYIADVGQGKWEEVDIGARGANYGWNVWEANERFTQGSTTGGTLTFPIHAYDHSVGQSITGGYVYRGESEGLQGQYFFADFVASKLFTLHLEGSTWVATERTSQIVPDAGSVASISSFGEDARGNLYVVDFGGEVFRLTPVVASGDGGDALDGRGGADFLFAGSGNDSLNGGTGDDVMHGGPGVDNAIFAGARSGYTITRSGTSFEIAGPDGNDILTGVERAVFGDASLRLMGPNLSDFDGTGRSALTLRHGPSGTLELLRFDGTMYSASHDIAPGSGWQFGSNRGDFNGDGRSDLVLTHPSGALELRQMSGLDYTAIRQLTPGAGWTLSSAQADLNGDGKSDLILQHGATGTVELMLMNGLDYSAVKDKGLSGWQIVDARGDFNGDGKSDLVLRNGATGTFEVMLMNGTDYTQARDYAWGPDWQVVDARGDFNGDGKSDLVLRHGPTGTVQLLQMNGADYSASHSLSPGASWTVASAASDFNADGKSDLVLRHTSGTLEFLQMNGLDYNAVLDRGYGPGWQVIDTSVDFNADGKTDLVMRDGGTGTIQTALMNGLNVTATHDYAFGTDWQVVT